MNRSIQTFRLPHQQLTHLVRTALLVLALAAEQVAAVAAAQVEYTPYPAVTDIPPVYPSEVSYDLQLLVDGLPLPVSVTPLGDGSGRLLVVSLLGRVWLLDDYALRPEPFLDLAARVTGRVGEQGLFTVALEPAPVTAGGERRIVTSFTEQGSGDLLVTAYPLTPDLRSADHTRETEILRIEMPEPFHHGGQVAFGPDGMLYFSIGSGEISIERLHVRPAPTQDLTSLLGKLLRLDLSVDPYRVPSDNPYTAESDPAAAALGARPEIWASGFRNPWKFTFGPNGELYVADVGADRWEEVNLAERGGNYGWPAREGRECFRLPDVAAFADPDCQNPLFSEPLVAYAHLRLDPQGGQTVTGGVVVTDPQLPELAGRYVYGDFGSGRVWSYDPVTERIELLLETGVTISEISAGEAGELLVLSINGRLFRLAHTD
ncbi:MAG: PQQ-dependent sugar dehydrogenase [Trueperaceae bacterium]